MARDFISFFFSIIILIFLLFIYIKTAKDKRVVTKIIRSKYSIVTVVGAGIIFPFIFLILALTYGGMSYLVLTGVLLISFVSLGDDIKSVKVIYRLLAHLFACSLVIYDLYSNTAINSPYIFWFIVLTFILLSYTNASNFMDGVHGMLGLNTFVSIIFLMLINYYFAFTNTFILLGLLIACIVFLTGNFRNKPLFISGDVGSISLGFIIGYFILKIYLEFGNPIIFLLTAIYAVETGVTFLIHLFKGVNIFNSHRNHLYEKLVFEKGISDLKISGIYGLFQCLIGFIVTYCIYHKIYSWGVLILTFLSLITIYVIFRGINFRNEFSKKTHN